MEDVHTHSNFNNVSVKHMSLMLTLDMNAKKFTGHVDLQIAQRADDDTLVLDTKSLIVHRAAISSGNADELQSTTIRMGELDEVRGQAIIIEIEPDTKFVRVDYETTKDSAGIDWIAPELTGDKFPMVVTQFQAINARTFVPCQDTPAQKITYDASIKLVSNVTDSRMGVLMAAMEREELGDRRYRFTMPNPIPTYLIALAAGVFEERPISNRVSVFAEPSMVEKAAVEFEQAEAMVQAAESLFGDYDWKRFDIFIMPPSFSYGGMENPTMTFIGPTVVAGDKSLVDVIAHELAHSWSGNWVTNKNWNEFWINEGTTMYIERLIVALLYGEALKNLDIVLGQQILVDDIKKIAERKGQGPALTRLKLDLTAAFDPDDAVSHVPYEKGFNFWLALEQAYGQPEVVKFLIGYFQQYAMGVMDSATLKKLIVAHPGFDGAAKVDIDDWFYGEGLPKAGLPKIESDMINVVDKAVSRLKMSVNALSSLAEAHDFETKQWSYFLKTAHVMPIERVRELNEQFCLSKKNDEVRSNFYVFVIRSGAFKIYADEISQYLHGVGRVKYVGPIYEALTEVGLTDVAIELYQKHKAHNNHITNGAISRRLP